MFGLSRNPEKYESRALAYDRKGKTQKAIKNREKAARLRAHAGNAGTAGSTTTTTTTWTQRTPATYERNALKWEQKNNWSKAQKNREKVWRMNNPQYSSAPAPAFYQNNQFVGYNVQPTTTGGLPLSTGGAAGANKGGLFHRTPEKYEARAVEYDRKNKPKKAQKNREKAAKLRSKQGYTGSQRNAASYDKNAMKWESRGNWTKAQKNREKAWRLQNPQYNNTAAPAFYQQNRFVGYNTPVASVPLAQASTVHMQKTSHTMVAPVVETRVHETIVETTARPERIVEVQPVIHREIDAPQVRVIEKHMYETVPSTGPSVITNQAIIQETVRPKIIEEVQPVIHREVPAPFVERVEQHVTEHITKPTVTTKEVIQGGAVAAGGLQQTQTTTTQTTTTRPL